MVAPRCLLLAVAVVALTAASADAAKGARAARALEGAYIVTLNGSAGSTDATVDDLQRKGGFRARLRFRRALRGFAARLTEQQADRLRAEPAVAAVTPDRPVRAVGGLALAPGDTPPTGVRRIGAAGGGAVWHASSVNVAVLDTGIDLSHPDLNAADGANCITPGATAQDDDGHGTHVAGTIGARNNGNGVVGVAPGTRIHAVKVLNGEGSGSFSQIICGIDWVTATRTDADPTNDIAVANLSLVGSGARVAPCAITTDPLHRAICASTQAGVTFVVAAGNDAWDFDNLAVPDLPAAYPEVLTVTAMSDSEGAPGGLGGTPSCRNGELDDRAANFSNYAVSSAGASHTVAAPGVCIRSTLPGGGYGTLSGTSMASPHIAGAVALCLAEGGKAGPCAGSSPAGIAVRIRDTAGGKEAGYGFTGDPLRPIAGRYFGPLAWAGLPVVEGDDGASTSAPPAGGSVPPASSAPAAATPAIGVGADRTAPNPALAIRRQALRTVMGRGLSLTVRCSEGCEAGLEAFVSGRAAKRFGLSRGATVRVGRRAPIRLSANARRSVVLKLSRAARVKLARAAKLALTVKLTVVDAAGNRRAVRRAVTLTRA